MNITLCEEAVYKFEWGVSCGARMIALWSVVWRVQDVQGAKSIIPIVCSFVRLHIVNGKGIIDIVNGSVCGAGVCSLCVVPSCNGSE